jgi:hypothetical protein
MLLFLTRSHLECEGGQQEEARMSDDGGEGPTARRPGLHAGLWGGGGERASVKVVMLMMMTTTMTTTG